MTNEDDWTRQERARLDALGAEAPPPEMLERRVVKELRKRGEIRAGAAARGPRQPRWLAAAAAAVVLFVGGAAAGRATAPDPVTVSAPAELPEPQYALLLYPGTPRPDQPEESALVREYAAWARSLGEQGHLTSGEKLGDASRLLAAGEAAAEVEPVQGFFLLRADSMEQAEALARTCPHLKYGGVIALRKIEPT